jgi:aminopeptidase N
VEDLIFNLAQNDEKNSVRAAAIEALSRNNPDKYIDFFKEQISHPSYYVAGAALAAYLENERNAGREEVAEEFAGERNIRVVVALANYYTAEQREDRADWFHDKLGELSGESLYYFLGYYGDFFARLDGEKQQEAIDNLYDIAAEHEANYVRLGAFQSLFGFYDEKGVKEKLRRLNEEETDEMVKRYQGFYLQNYGGN